MTSGQRMESHELVVVAVGKRDMEFITCSFPEVSIDRVVMLFF
jgi:hypothetical protein